MVMFKKPNWLKPEINEPKYYLHIAIIVVIALMALKYLFSHDMFTWMWGIKLGIAVILGDIFAHSILNLK